MLSWLKSKEFMWMWFGLSIHNHKMHHISLSDGKKVKTVIPEFIREFISHTWNIYACWYYGHNYVLQDIPEVHNPDGTFDCVDCCKPLSAK